MRRRLVESTALALVALGAWADKHRAHGRLPVRRGLGLVRIPLRQRRQVGSHRAALRPRGFMAPRPSPSTRRSPSAPCTTARWWASRTIRPGYRGARSTGRTTGPRWRTPHWHARSAVFPSLGRRAWSAINALERRFAAQFHGGRGRGAHERSAAQGRAGRRRNSCGRCCRRGSRPSRTVHMSRIWCPAPGSRRARPAADPLQSCWGQPWPMASPSRRVRARHLEFSADLGFMFGAAALEVHHTGLTSRRSRRPSPSTGPTGRGDGTPVGHWVAIVGQIARGTTACWPTAAEAYTRWIAVADAFIACWYTKHFPNSPAPGDDIQDYIDGSWLPHLVTSPFLDVYPPGTPPSRAPLRRSSPTCSKQGVHRHHHTDHHPMPPQELRACSARSTSLMVIGSEVMRTPTAS